MTGETVRLSRTAPAVEALISALLETPERKTPKGFPSGNNLSIVPNYGPLLFKSIAQLVCDQIKRCPEVRCVLRALCLWLEAVDWQVMPAYMFDDAA
jgi:hypothetical protein